MTQVAPKVALLVDESALFKKIDVALRDKLKAAGKLQAYAPGQTIIAEGEPSEGIWIIAKGKVAVSTCNEHGQVLLAELGAHAILGEVATLTHARRTSTAKALEMTEAVFFSTEVIHEVTAAAPRVRELLERVVEKRALDAIDKVVNHEHS